MSSATSLLNHLIEALLNHLIEARGIGARAASHSAKWSLGLVSRHLLRFSTN